MIVTLILLNSGEYIIAQAEILEYEPKCHLKNAYSVSGTTRIQLTQWPLYTDEEDVMLHSTSIKTECVPTDELLEKYLKKVGKTLEEIETPSQVLLTEEPEDYGFRDFPTDENNEVMYVEE